MSGILKLTVLLPLLKLIIDSGAVSPIAPTDVTTDFEEKFGEPEKKIGDYCESGFGLPVGTYCLNNKVTLTLK